ncbi:MAG: GspE/PulE family protein [Candidatus Saganbacteria bacterium]|nr:GspE/PulE family protein [Candidatus Saganbacteria bacterium]
MKKEHPQQQNLNGATTLVNDLIEKAVGIGASDIHLEPTQHNLKVRFRVDGILQNAVTVHRSMISSVVSRVKIMVDLDIAETRLPQDGKTHLSMGGKEIDIRVSTIPVIFGEKTVLRLLDRNSILRTLDDLGMQEEDLHKYRKVINRPQGLVLVTGPTGSGKTTTLYASLNEINSPEKNIIAIEDPVEYQLPNINQTQVNYKTGYSFEKGLRSILRQDPDIVMVGEIRDEVTARIAVQAAMTGHLVFSTLHTNSAAGAIERLTDMGIENYLIASSLSCVIGQRLVRLSCPKCRECSFTGFKGRTGIYEIIFISDEIRNLISKKAERKSLEKAASLKNLFEAGIEKAKDGLTTEEEVQKSVCQDQ